MNEYTINAIGFIAGFFSAYALAVHTADWFNNDWMGVLSLLVLGPAIGFVTILILDHFFGTDISRIND